MSVLKIKDQNNNWTQIPTIKGDKGDPFTYADFTSEQLESLKGKDGISPTVSVVSDTSDDYRLSFTDETHTVTTPNLIPEAEKFLSAYPTDTASGSIASFSDGADDIPLKSLVVDINPIQDLHGQENPYPAGAGANKWDEVWESGAFNASGELLTDSNSIRAKNFCPCAENTDYCFMKPANTYFQYCFYDSSKTLLLRNAFRSSATLVVTSPAGSAYFKIAMGDATTPVTTYGNNIAVNYPSTVTTYSPYENICPISGRTGCEVQRTGNNLLNLVESEMVLSGWNRIFPISLKAGTYIISCQNQFGASTKGAAVALVDDNATTVIKWLSGYEFGDSTFVGRATIITEEEASKIKNLRFALRASGVTYNDIVQGNIQLEHGSTATEYEPYTGRTIPITFPTEAGTVYGGYVDVTGGELVADRAIVDLGTCDIREWVDTGITNHLYYAMLPDRLPYYASNGEPVYLKCSALKPIETTRAIGYFKTLEPNTVAIRQTITDRVYIKSEIDTVEAMKQSLDGVQLVYPLAEPIHYPISQIEIRTLLGVNNIWSNTGDTEVIYRADTTLYIKRLTESDTDMIADSNIVSGQYFMIGTDLYKATANIASGANVIVGTNATKVSLAQALNEIKEAQNV